MNAPKDLSSSVNPTDAHTSYLNLTWQQYEEAADKIAEHLAGHFQNSVTKMLDIRSIYGVPRGGIFLADRISRRLGFSREQSFKKRIALNYSFHRLATVIVDDVADSGKTLEKLTKFQVGVVYTVTWVRKPQSIVTPDFSVDVVSDDTWVNFPWEVEALYG